jgi:hypothetical protein
MLDVAFHRREKKMEKQPKGKSKPAGSSAKPDQKSGATSKKPGKK